MQYYALSRLLSFRSKLMHSQSSIIQSMFVTSPHSRLVNVWNVQLRSYHVDGNNLSRAELMPLVRQAWLGHIKSFCADPRQDVCNHRKMCSYVSWVWDGKLGHRPAYHAWQLPYTVWRSMLCYRTMNSNLPVHTMLRVPLHDRQCRFCTGAPADLLHALLQCSQLDLVSCDYWERMGEPQDLHSSMNCSCPVVAFYIHKICKLFAIDRC